MATRHSQQYAIAFWDNIMHFWHQNRHWKGNCHVLQSVSRKKQNFIGHAIVKKRSNMVASQDTNLTGLGLEIPFAYTIINWNCVFLVVKGKMRWNLTKEATHRWWLYLAYPWLLGDGSDFADVRQGVKEFFRRGLEHGSLGGHGKREIIRFHRGRRIAHANFNVSFVTFSHF